MTDSAMNIELVSTEPRPSLVREARDVYAAAFAQAPYRETAEQAAAFEQRLARYARERDGFRFVTARGGDGQLAGMALAVLARPGDWWRDQVARALGEPAAQRWLGAVCLEVVHVAVAPGAQRQGIGRQIHDVLISGRPAPTGILSCHPGALPAQRLYTERGWRLLTEDFRIGAGPDSWLMARSL